MEKAVPGKTGIEEDRMLRSPGENPDEAGEAVLGKERVARVEWQPVVHGGYRRYKDIDIIVDQDGHFDPVGRF
jgi:hypothetical protein